jgi:glycosyltransferase involved in cell wall biosynthesis
MGVHSRTGQSAESITLVLPAKNEASNLPWVLPHIPDFVDEVVLVDGGSHDATAACALQHRPDIRLVRQYDGRGKGSGVRAGFHRSTGDIVVMMDADGSMSPAEIRALIQPLTSGYDFVKGSRFIQGGGSEDLTLWRRLGNQLLVTVLNRLYGTQYTDLCYGFCAFRRSHLEQLGLLADGFEIEAEMVVRAIVAGLRVAEVPSLERPRRSGRSNLRSVRDGLRVLRVILRNRRRGVSGRLNRPSADAVR